MKSMTGYGRGEGARNGSKVTLEANSVNRKQSEIVLILPRELEALDGRLRDEINRQIARGRLTVRVSLHLGEDACASRVQLNIPLAKACARELARLAKDLGIPTGVTLDALLRVPGVVESCDDARDAETYWPILEAAMKKALTALLKMREKEGAHLAKDLQARVSSMRKVVAEVRKQVPHVVKRFQQQLLERIKNAGLDAPDPDDERLIKEVVFFADRSDISEELTRLQSHFQQFDECLKATEPVGRTLDFLAQEMNREINTIGSKANDALISRAVVTLKTELERFREQAQNVE